MHPLAVDVDGRSVAGVSLVTVSIRNRTPVDQRVRVANDLDGPVLPPRREGVPERGWRDDGFLGVVAAEDRLVLGYACPAPLSDQPASVSALGRVEAAEADARGDAAADAVRELGSPAPPASVVPVESAAPGDARRESGTADGADATDVVDATREAGRVHDPVAAGDVDAPAGDTRPDTPPSAAAVTAWLDAVEERVAVAERLTDASVPRAAAALEDAGGLTAVSGLTETLETDVATLERVAARASRLAARAEEADVPLSALRRLA